SKQPVFRGEIVVELDDVVLLVIRLGGGEGVEAGVDAITAASGVIDVRIARIDEVEEGSAVPDSSGIQCLNLRRGVETDALRLVVLAAGAGAARSIQDVADVAAAVVVERNGAVDECGLDDARVVEVKEEEGLVAPQYGTTEIAAELVADVIRLGDVAVVAEPRVGDEGSVAVVFEEDAVEVVGAGLGDEVELAAAAGAAIGGEAADGAFELLHGVD